MWRRNTANCDAFAALVDSSSPVVLKEEGWRRALCENTIAVNDRLFFATTGDESPLRLGKLKYADVNMLSSVGRAEGTTLTIRLVDPGRACKFDPKLVTLESQCGAVTASMLSVIKVRLVEPSAQGTGCKVDVLVNMRVRGLNADRNCVLLDLYRAIVPVRRGAKRQGVQKVRPHRWQKSVEDLFGGKQIRQVPR